MTSVGRANEIHSLVERLSGGSPDQVDAAAARLAVIGSPAVESLIRALDDPSPRTRAQVMELLALIRDPRALGPLLNLALRGDTASRRVALEQLSSFPSAETNAAMEDRLAEEPDEELRALVVRRLAECVRAGHDASLARLLDILFDADEAAAARLSAAEVLRALPADQADAALSRLTNDPDPEVRRRAAELRDASGTDEPGSRIERDVERLADGDYATWSTAIRSLADRGPRAVGPLLDALARRGHDPAFCTRIGMALKAMHPRRGAPLVQALETLEEPHALLVLVDVIGTSADKALIYRLKDLIDALPALAERSDPRSRDGLRRVRARAHLELARIGSRVAVYDLQLALAERDHPVELEILAAVELIGKREEVLELLRARRTEDGFTRARIDDVVRAIFRRERLRRGGAFWDGLANEQREALDEILAADSGRQRRRGRRTRRNPRAEPAD